MYCSSSLVLVVITNLLLSEANCQRYTEDSRGRKYDKPLYGDYEDTVVNIGNGVNRKNVVVIDNRPDNVDSRYPNTRDRSQPDPLGNRFGGGQDYPNYGHGSSVNNIGNGYQNRNTVVVNGDRRTVVAPPGESNGWNNGGTTFVSRGDGGSDVYNVGYGPGNQNKVTVNGRPITPDCHGSSCVQMYPRKISNAPRSTLSFYVFLSFVTFYLILA